MTDEERLLLNVKKLLAFVRNNGWDDNQLLAVCQYVFKQYQDHKTRLKLKRNVDPSLH